MVAPIAVIIAVPGRDSDGIVAQLIIRRDGSVHCFGDVSLCIDAMVLVARSPLPPRPGVPHETLSPE